MSKWRKEFIQMPENSLAVVEIVSNASITSQTVGDGRNIPLIIIDCSKRPDILNLFENQKINKNGEVKTRWIRTSKNKNIIGIMFEFVSPVECKFFVEMDITISGALVNLIVLSQALYIQCGEKGDRLINNFNANRIIVEINSDEFKDEWGSIYKAQMTKYFKKKYNISLRKAEKIANDFIKEFSKFNNLRI